MEPVSPASNATSPTANQDTEHLRLLSIFHYIAGGFGIFFAFIPLLYVILGALTFVSPSTMADNNGQPMPEALGIFFIAFGLFFAFSGWAIAICTIISGRRMAKQKRRVFSIVVAAILCLFVPIGTILGIFTIVVLTKDSVRRLYEQKQQQTPPPELPATAD